MTRSNCIWLAILAYVASVTPAAEAPGPPVVVVANPVQRVMEYHEFNVQLEPAAMIEIRAGATGRVQQFHVEPPVAVAKGDLLVTLEIPDAQARQAEAMQRLQPLTERLEQLDRQLEQLQQSGGPAFERDRLAAEREVVVARMKLAHLAIQQAERDLAQSHIVAPRSGWLQHFDVSRGDRVWASFNSATRVGTLLATDPVFATFELDEDTYLRLRRWIAATPSEKAPTGGRSAELALPGEMEFDHHGRVDCSDNRIDPVTGRIRFRGEFPNPDGQLTEAILKRRAADRVARMRIKFEVPRVAWTVPRSAIGTSADGRQFVLVVNDRNIVERRVVELGARWNGWQGIETGLTGEDRVVLHAQPAGSLADDELSPDDFTPDVSAPGVRPGTLVRPLLIDVSDVAIPRPLENIHE